MYLQEIVGILPAQFVKIKYDCDGGFEKCGKEWSLKFKDAKKNFEQNDGKHICRQCHLRNKNPMRRKEVREKVKETTIERYGVATVMNLPKNVKARNEKMFGTQEAIDARTEKTKKTNLERYGVEHAAQSEEKKQKTLETFREKYGTDHPMQNEEVKKQMQETCQERYGVDNPMQRPEFQLALAKSIFDKYGVEHYNQLPEMKEYLRQNCTTWLAESYAAGGPNKGITRPEEWNKKQRDTVISLILEGKWHAGHRNTLRGYYNSLGKCKKRTSFFRSGFELLYHYHLDIIDQEVEWYDYEPFHIDYTKSDGTNHAYIPDFIVKYKSSDMLFIKEVKADYLHDSDDTRKKYEAAIEFVKNNLNMCYTVLLKEDIYKLELNIDTIRNLPNVTITHDPRLK